MGIVKSGDMAAVDSTDVPSGKVKNQPPKNSNNYARLSNAPIQNNSYNRI